MAPKTLSIAIKLDGVSRELQKVSDRIIAETQEALRAQVVALDLVAVGDVAERATEAAGRSYTVGAVGQWLRRHDDAPRPVAITSAGYIWRWADWETWLRQTGRIPSE